jgi:hypothetical protein
MKGYAMNDAAGLLVSAAALVLISVCLLRLALGRADFAALYRAPAGDGWPHGTQEGDCPRWCLDGERPTQAARPTAPIGRNDDAAELLACTVNEVATLEPAAAGRDRVHIVQPRVAVHGHVGLAGRA